MTYGEAIRRSREAHCWTQEQLAEALGVSRQAVSKWEADLSRPARAKLERLSAVLELPPETWTAIDAEQTAAERPPDRSGPWKIAAGILAVVCAGLAVTLAVVLWRQYSTLVPSEEAAADGQPAAGPDSLAQVFPETLPLTVRREFDFGDTPVGECGEDRVPFLHDARERQEQEIWSGYLGDGDGSPLPGLALSVVKTNPVHENRTTFYDIYLLYALPDSAGDPDWRIFTCLAEYNHYVDLDGFKAEKFTNVLGHDGYKLSIIIGASAGYFDYYITQRPDGSPALMTTSSNAREFDVDEDGVLEIVSIDEIPWYCKITDTREGEEGALVYTLDPAGGGFRNVGIAFAPEKGGFVVTDSQNAVLARYLLRDGEMVRQPLTDFTAQDWPDVTRTKITFITDDGDGLADGRDPDELLYGGRYRITHRQQAYLALQELYRLTGLRVEECCCAASEFGVYFSLLPDGCNQRCFFSADLGGDYGAAGGIPDLYIAWKELGNDWSPLSLEDAARPEAWVAEENTLRWYYDRLEVLHTGEAAIETGGQYAGERYLYLENGDLFVGQLENTHWGLVMTSLIGPYPDGEVNH